MMSTIDFWVPDSQSTGQRRAIAAYLQAFTEEGSLVLEPFCRSDALTSLAAGEGRRVLAVSFNRLDALRTRVALLTIPKRELDSALTRIADSRKANLTLREHLSRLYRTTCLRCGQETQADYYVWERSETLPSQVRFVCPACGESGLKATDDFDEQILKEIPARGLHYWHLLDRIAPQEGNARKVATDLLQLYSPRSLYVISNLQLKIDALFSASPLCDLFRFALLEAMQRGTKLNAVPGDPPASHSSGLRPPQRYAEWNIWRLFERAARALGGQQPSPPVLLESKPDQIASPESTSGCFVGHLTVRKLAATVPKASAHLVWVEAPPLGRTHWALPYLWTGCLFGRRAAAALWPLVRRRSSDWSWYLSAMRSALAALATTLRQDGRLVLVGPSKGAAFHETVTMAAASAGLQPETSVYHALEPELPTKPFGGLLGDYRSTWRAGAAGPQWPMETPELLTNCRAAAVQAAKELLTARAEPVPYARLQAHIWETLARRSLLQRTLLIQDLGAPLDWVRQQVSMALQSAVGTVLVQLWKDEEKEECLWWLARPQEATPLAERVEAAVATLLEQHSPVDLTDLLSQVYQSFPGVLTPDEAWILACIKSYASPLEGGQWLMNQADHAQVRSAARNDLLSLLVFLGQKGGYDCRVDQNHGTVYWAQGGRETAALMVLDSGSLSSLLYQPIPAAVTRAFAILPKARLDLIRARFERSPNLRQELAARHWQFIHDQDLLLWATGNETRPDGLSSLVSLEPFTTQEPGQLSLL
ncbi:MAG TPA: hypothetical protein PKJ21_01490 [Anaerolineae bacterium]|nr:hypothetical protein [Anaerolineae bacterium]HNT04841.1 hypothetical protein [Anaerolineae bacterium]